MNYPRVGIGVFIRNNKNEYLFGLRKSKLGTNTWSLPGGKLDFGEDLRDCAKRETKEETNLDIDINDLVYVGLTNDVIDEENHYITIFFETKIFKGNLELTEPDKCEKWEWFKFDNLPKELFLPITNFINNNFY